MEWVVPEHKREIVNRAGRSLLNPVTTDEGWAEWDRALDIIYNWRASHAYPLNTFQVTLRRKTRLINSKALVGQRLKRAISIYSKLQREPSMKLTQMQDIGGCRAVLRSPKEVARLVKSYKGADFDHDLTHEDDYIQAPRRSGYRGHHLIYKYRNGSNPVWDDLKIEIQIRSLLQHAWATAVETVDIFLKFALKASQGPDDWKRFFALMGSAMALRERRPIVPETPTRKTELFRELKHCAASLEVVRRLQTFGSTIQNIERVKPQGGGRQHFLLLEVDPSAAKTTITGFRKEESERATQAFSDAEKRLGMNATADVVLVSVQTLQSLQRAYPNYFLDTDLFLKALDHALDGA